MAWWWPSNMWYANVNESLTGLIYVVPAPSVPSISHFSLNEKVRLNVVRILSSLYQVV